MPLWPGDGGTDMRKLILLVAAVLLLAAVPAGAQPYEAGESWKGVRGAIGVGLLGMELTMTIEAAAGVQNPWLLSLIPLAVGGGAAAGGYYMEQESTTAGIITMAFGTTLLVPSILLTLVLSADEYEAAPGTETESLSGSGSEGGLPPVGSATARGFARYRRAPSLVEVADGDLRLGVPSLAMLEAPTASLYGPGSAAGGVEYRLALVGGTF